MIYKYAYEEFLRTHEFGGDDGWLASGETLSGTPGVTVTDKSTGADTSGAMVSSISVYNSTQVKYLLKAGTSGHTYTIAIKVVTSNGQKFEDRLELGVK